MSIIDDVRREREDLARVLKKHPGIRKIVEDLYPDNAHFIYELLQNAEDTGATEAIFTLSEASLAFEHNGSPFQPRDIYAITDIGEGAKAADDDKIGRFGVGFKAVFAYSETPHIWSPTFSFKITDLVLPWELDGRPDLGNTTRFEFSFNNAKKKREQAYAEVKAGLNGLAETTLLFLSHLKCVRWQIGKGMSTAVKRIEHPDNHVEVLKESVGMTTDSYHFLKFHQPVEGLDKHRVAVAFELDRLSNEAFDHSKPLQTQFKIIPAKRGRVAVFFPAETEDSRLRFHLHAPFVPELSRASIKKTPANQPLFQQLATLTAAKLHTIRDLGLLTAEFLAVLPNLMDGIPPPYQCIRSAIIEQMINEPLTPTYAKGHAPAKCLLQAKASLKELLSDEDIEFLVVLANWERTEASELPEHESRSPTLRNERVGAGVADAPERRTEQRTRTVSVGREEVKEEAREYLREMYTNADDEMICQVCKAVLPFKLDDGSDYFEAVEFLPELKRWHPENCLALCPNHAAMFKHANGSRDRIREDFVDLTGSELPVVLAKKATTIYFTTTHRDDLKAVIQTEQELSRGEGDGGQNE